MTATSGGGTIEVTASGTATCEVGGPSESAIRGVISGRVGVLLALGEVTSGGGTIEVMASGTATCEVGGPSESAIRDAVSERVGVPLGEVTTGVAEVGRETSDCSILGFLFL